MPKGTEPLAAIKYADVIAGWRYRDRRAYGGGEALIFSRNLDGRMISHAVMVAPDMTVAAVSRALSAQTRRAKAAA